MRFYVAGPMSGYPEYNHPAFHAATTELRALGHFVINPAEMDEGVDLSVYGDDTEQLWIDCLHRDLQAIGKHRINAMLMLPGWERSRGARVENSLALSLGMEVYYPDQPLPAATIPTPPTMIGLSGWARTGKDTVADILCAQWAYVRVSFADPLRVVLRQIDPWVDVDGTKWRLTHMVRGEGPGHVADWNDLKALTDDARRMMVALGDGIRAFAPDFWLDQGLAQTAHGGHYVFADVRNPNEADAIRANGGVVIRVERPGVTPACDPATGRPYRLETALDDYAFDLRIVNDGTVEDLSDKVAALIGGFGAAPVPMLREESSVRT